MGVDRQTNENGEPQSRPHICSSPTYVHVWRMTGMACKFSGGWTIFSINSIQATCIYINNTSESLIYIMHKIKPGWKAKLLTCENNFMMSGYRIPISLTSCWCSKKEKNIIVDSQQYLLNWTGHFFLCYDVATVLYTLVFFPCVNVKGRFSRV